MSQLDKNTIKKLTELCRIRCTEDEQAALLQDLQNIIDYIDQLAEINTENVPPCSCVLEGMCNVMRDDKIGEIMPREELLKNAPAHTGGLIRVPPIISKSSVPGMEE